jgi:hypothetical protein
MAKSRKPYPGMGAYVLLLNYSGTWVAHMGANTEDKLRKERARLPQWPADRVKIVPNTPKP